MEETTHNYAAEFKRDVLVRVIKAFLSNDFMNNVNRVPIEMRPKHASPVRCCIYKERAVATERCLGVLGFSIEETDESVPLSEYARQALEREKPQEPVLTVIDIACKGCVPSRYYVTDLCQGCLERPCMQCPFGAIEFRNGRSYINPEKCKSCGKCAELCHYHAIVKRVVPCEEACPTKAIAKDENGVAKIDYEKCIACGRCKNACSFAAIIGKSQIIDVLKAIKAGKKVVAMLAPAIVGQFGSVPVGQLLSAVQKVGFSEAMEVAHGADTTTRLEAKELAERLQNGAPFMTTSCCPAYTNLVNLHIPELKEFVSHTRTPMHYAAEIVKRQDPKAVAVFVGPCSAKRDEGIRDEFVDFVITAQELDALFEAKGIHIADCEPIKEAKEPSKQGRGFPITGGVAGAVASLKTCEVCPLTINGLNKENIRLLKQYAKTKKSDGYNLIEVMSCAGGCVAGPIVVENPKKATKEIQKIMADSSDLKMEE